MNKTEYRKEIEQKCINQAEAIVKNLPSYVEEYLDSMIAKEKSAVTINTYVQRIAVFFQYLAEYRFDCIQPKDISPENLNSLQEKDIERFLIKLKKNQINTSEKQRAESGEQRSAASINNYLSAVHSFMKFAKQNGLIDHDPSKEVEGAKKSKRDDVVHIEKEEEPAFLASVQKGRGMTDRQQKFRTGFSCARDEAVCQTILLTGIRVSELVGLDIEDVNFRLHEIHIYRKEGKSSKVFMPDKLEDILQNYLLIRSQTFPESKNKALFLSGRGKEKGNRLSVRSIQILVKKYACAAGIQNASEISPHRLRATFAMDMIEATSDLSLTQQALSHESPATTSVYIGKREKALKQNRNVLTEKNKENSLS